jgi:Mrp family chromosome partitioning ATPase/capsular polysaccharide biosynthesis protein
MSNTSALAAVRSRWWVVALLTAAGALFGALPTPERVDEQSLTTTYRATHTLLVNVQEALQSTSLTIAPSQVTLLATNGEVPRRVAEQISFDGNTAELASQVTVVFDPGTGALTFTTTQTSADQAVLIADTFANTTNSYLAERQDALYQDRLVASNARLELLREQAADVSARAAANPGDIGIAAESDAIQNQLAVAIEQNSILSQSPTVLSFTTLAAAEPIALEQASGLSTPRSRSARGALGGIVGLALGIGVAVALARLDRRLRTREQAEEVTGLRARVIIPKAKDDKQANTIVSSGRHDALSDAYRTLRNVVGFVQHSLPPADRARITLIVSPGPGEGKTTLAGNLAATFAETGQRTVAVNTDFRRPQLAVRLTDNPWEPTAYILDDLDWLEPEQLLRNTRVPNLSMLDLGGLGSPDELARVTASLLPKLADRSDAIVIDSSPVTATAEVLELVPLADVIVVVVRLNRTEMESAQRTIAILKDLTTAPLLLVISGMKQDNATYYYDYKDRRQGSKPVDGKGKRRSDATRTASPQQLTRPTNGAPPPPAPPPVPTNGRAPMLDLDEIDEFLRQQPPPPR